MTNSVAVSMQLANVSWGRYLAPVVNQGHTHLSHFYLTTWSTYQLT